MLSIFLVEERENCLKKKEFPIYSDTRFYSPVDEISWNLMNFFLRLPFSKLSL